MEMVLVVRLIPLAEAISGEKELIHRSMQALLEAITLLPVRNATSQVLDSLPLLVKVLLRTSFCSVVESELNPRRIR